MNTNKTSNYLKDIPPGLQFLEKLDSFLGPLVLLNLVTDNKGNLWNLLNLVSLGHHQGWNSRGSKG